MTLMSVLPRWRCVIFNIELPGKRPCLLTVWRGRMHWRLQSASTDGYAW